MLTRRNQNDVQIEVKKGAGKRTTTPQKVFKFCKYACLLNIIAGIGSELMIGNGLDKVVVNIIFWPIIWMVGYLGFFWLYRKFQAGKQTYYDAVNFRDDIDQ